MQYVVQKNSGNTLQVMARETLTVDSDNDGLQDWEEALWKTDPKNPDTDGDGTLDGNEVNLNRNPLKTGPDDKNPSSPSFENLNKNEGGFAQDNTLTGSYARKFLTDYLTLKNQKGTLSESDKESLITSLVGDISAVPTEAADVYSVSDVAVSSDNSEEVVEKYSNEVKRIFIDESFVPENELVVFERLVDGVASGSIDDEDINKLNIAADVYAKAAIGMTKLTMVPSNAAQSHADIINGLKNTGLAIKDMVKLPSDPIKAIAGMKIYQQEVQRIYDAGQNLQNIFNQYGIIIF